MRLAQSLRAHHSIAPGTGLITRAWLEIGHAHALLAPLHGAGAPFFYSALDTAQNAASSVALGSAVVAREVATKVRQIQRCLPVRILTKKIELCANEKIEL